MNDLVAIITIIEQNKLPISISFAWLVREYPTITKLGGVIGILRALIIGSPKANPPLSPSETAMTPGTTAQGHS